MKTLILWTISLFFILGNFVLINNAFADTGLGEVANNLMEPVDVLSSFVNTACFAIGGAFLFTSIIKYFEHRRSPLLVPISTVVFLVIAGLILIALPFLPYLTGHVNH